MTSDPYTRWTGLADSELTVDNVHDTLNAINDDLWVATACLDRLVDDIPTQRALLEIGIERTASVLQRCKDTLTETDSPLDGDDDEESGQSSSSTPQTTRTQDALQTYLRATPADARLCHIRHVLLGRLDYLNTYEEICKGTPECAPEDVEKDVEDWEDDPWVDDTAGTSAVSQDTSTPPPIPLSTFLVGNLLDSACLLALHQWFKGLQTLLERHGSELWPYRLAILDNIPGHADPSKYSDLLPSSDPATSSELAAASNRWRPETDLVETEEVQTALEASGIVPGVVGSSRSYEDFDPHKELLSAEELTSWYNHRVETIIASNGMVDTALTVVQHGASHGISGLDELGEELSLFSRLVYDASHNDEHDDDWTLDRWRSMDPPAAIRAYLAHSSPESLPKDISRLVIPYLFVLESRAERAGTPDPSIPTRLLYDYILTSTLENVAVIFEASKPNLPSAQRVIKNDEDLVRLALACLYGSDSLHEWATMSRIFECLPAWDISEDEEEDAFETTIVSLGNFVTPSTTGTHCTASDLLIFFKPLPISSLSHALDILDVHLESGEILSRWSVPAPLRWFLRSRSDVSQQRAWANRMARRAGGSEDRLNTLEDWEWLLEDMTKLSGGGGNQLRGAFGLLSQKEIAQIYLAGLLSTGRFDIAKSLLHSSHPKLSLDPDTIEEICLSSSREFYDNASSGNYKFGDMKLAYDCLEVLSPSERLVKEMEFIEATSRLSSFNVMSRPGMPISPIEIRLTKDRLSLVSRVLSSTDDAYKHTEVILDLVYKLGFRGDITAEVKTLAMLADTALQAEDFTRAYETSERMVDTVLSLRASTPAGLDDAKIREASEVCWVACFQLGRQPEFEDIEKKMSLLGRALELCPPDKLHDVLTAWRRLEKEDIEVREERHSHVRSGPAGSSIPRKRAAAAPTAAASLRSRLHDFHLPSPPLLNTPDAAALASRTFRTVAANFPFSVGSRGRSHASHQDDDRSDRSGSRRRLDGEDVSAQATRVLSKGIGWLIGTDEDS